MATKPIKRTEAVLVLNKIYAEATGKQNLTLPTNASDYISLATMTLDLGADVVINTITNIMNKTLFKERTYHAQFKGLEVGKEEFGFISRKLQVVDSDFKEDAGYKEALQNDGTVDMYVIRKRDILQTTVTNSVPYQDFYTIHQKQYNTAFKSAEELANFWSMLVTNAQNKFEQAKEEFKRATLVNFIGAKLNYATTDTSTMHVCKLLTEYNAKTGKSLTAQTVYEPSNFKDFVLYAYARIKTLSQNMANRNVEHQLTITGKPVPHTTPIEYQNFFMLNSFQNEIDAMAISEVYNKDQLSMPKAEWVTHWQTPKEPSKINIKSILLDNKGKEKEVEAVENNNVLAVIMDKDACMMTSFDEQVSNTPFNARGRYWNQFYNADFRAMNDFTEKGIVFVLE